MSAIDLVISSPNGSIFNEEVSFLSLRGEQGDLAILPGHAPFMTSVKEGECKIEKADGTVLKAYLRSGILTVTGERAVLVSGTFEFK